MKRAKSILIFTVCLVMLFWVKGTDVYGETWEFGTSGQGQNPFTPRGYLIATDDGVHWLSSRFDNSTGTVLYKSTLNGISYIDAKKVDGGTYTLYALTDRNPKVYQYLTAYKNGKVISDFSSYVGAPGRLEEGQNLGSGANWAIPITGFVFEPGALYEFAFLRGMQANNGITLVFSEDGKGYIKNPSTQDEIKKYEADRYKEYEFMSSYWVTKTASGEYVYDFHLVPMRFSVQTYADLSTWEQAAEEARAFLNTVTPADVKAGKFHQSNLDNLKLLLESQEQQAQKVVRKQLQDKAEKTMAGMVKELSQALEQAKSSQAMKADISVLKELLEDARALYKIASQRIGDGIGEYAGDRVAELAAAIKAAEPLGERSPQTQIENAIDDLEEAIVRVHNSVVRGKTIALHDDASGVSVVAPEGALPEDTVLFVDTVEENISSYRDVKAHFGDEVGEIFMYDIRLYSGDLVVQPTAEVEVQIPTDERTEKRSVAVYAADNGKNPQRISSLNPKGYRYFLTERVGIFALTLKASTAGVFESSGEEKKENVTLLDETEVELSGEPDRLNEELVEDIGKSDRPEKESPEMAADHQLLDQVYIPLEKLKREGDPAILLLAAGLLLLSALMAAAVVLFARRKREFLHRKV